MMIFKGMCVGVANLIPGLSGGTMAVILGVYDPLIKHLSGFFKAPLNKTHLYFLIKLGSGAVVGIVCFAKIMTLCLTHAPTPTYFTLMGLVAGSIPVMLKSQKIVMTRSTLLIGIFSAVLLVGIAFLPERGNQGDVSVMMFFGSGLIAAAAMIVPGLSGSFLLLVMGTYHAILLSVTELNFQALGVVSFGAVMGIIGITQILKWILDRYPHHMHMAILGLLAGSMFKLWPGLPLNTTGLLSVMLFGLSFWGVKKVG